MTVATSPSPAAAAAAAMPMTTARRARRQVGGGPLQLPAGHAQLFLHTCCAPCSGEVMRELHEAGVAYTLYFYNPNIHPQKEYLLRKQENLRYAQTLGVPVVDADYDPGRWFGLARGMEDAPERGVRCDMCFHMRLVATAEAAVARGFSLFATVLGISRWKNMAQIDRAGHAAAKAIAGSQYWAVNWRKGGGAERMVTLAKAQRFYQQQYCGCAYSLRDQNRYRRAQGRLPIVLGQDYYGPADAPGEPIPQATAAAAANQ